MKTIKPLFLLSLFLITVSLTAQTTEIAFLKSYATKGVQENFHESSEITSGGYTYVAGSSIGNDGHYDILLTKYHGTTEQWSVNWGTSNNGDDYSADIAVDGNGNLLVCGTSQINGDIDYDAVLLKFSPSGTLLWDETFDGSSSLLDGFVSVATDANSNVYVCGGSVTTSEQANFVTIKYNSSGVEQWTSFYDFNDLNDVATKLLVVGNSVRVSGASQDTSDDWLMTTVSYNGVLQERNLLLSKQAGLEKELT